MSNKIVKLEDKDGNTLYPLGIAAGNDTVTTDAIQDGAVTTAKLANNTVTEAKIAPNAVSHSKLGLGGVYGDANGATSVVTGNIAMGTIGTGNLRDHAVSEGKYSLGYKTTNKTNFSISTSYKSVAALSSLTAGVWLLMASVQVIGAAADWIHIQFYNSTASSVIGLPSGGQSWEKHASTTEVNTVTAVVTLTETSQIQLRLQADTSVSASTYNNLAFHAIRLF